MAKKRGPKVKNGPREPNGRISRSIVATLNEADRQRDISEMVTVLAQPHRRGSTDQRCSSALGRFVLAQGLRSEVYDAGNEYALLVARWRAARGIPTPIRLGYGGDGEGPSDATVASWAQQIGKIELAVVPVSHAGFLAMRSLILDDRDIPSALWREATISLGELTKVMGKMPSGGHPFLSGERFQQSQMTAL